MRWRARLLVKAESLSRWPERCPLAPENDAFPEEVRHLVFGSYRLLFTILASAEVWLLEDLLHADGRREDLELVEGQKVAAVVGVDAVYVVGEHRRDEDHVEESAASNLVTAHEVHPPRNQVGGNRENLEAGSREEGAQGVERPLDRASLGNLLRIGDDAVELGEHPWCDAETRGGLDGTLEQCVAGNSGGSLNPQRASSRFQPAEAAGAVGEQTVRLREPA